VVRFICPKRHAEADPRQALGALDLALDNESVRKRLLDLGCDIPDKTQRGQEQLAALVKSEIARWGPIIKAANVKNE